MGSGVLTIMVKLYHYTDKAGYDAIRKTKKILKSSVGKGDAVMGSGVYLTSLSPQGRSKIVIAKNNYDGNQYLFANQQNSDGKVDYWFEFDIPESKLSKYPGKRDIWLYKDQDLSFADHSPTGQGDFNSFGKVKASADELERLKDFLDIIDKATSGAVPWALLIGAALAKANVAQ